MSKSVALLLVIFFLTASCTAIVEPASSSTDVIEDSWVEKAPMKVARTGLGVAVLNSKIYAIGGSTASGFLPMVGGGAVLGYSDLGGHVGTNEEYDPETDTWTTKTSMPTPRIVFATAVCQNKIYCIGGKTSNGLTVVNEAYDPATDTWETKASMPTARGWLTAGVVKGKIYLIGGSPNGTLNEVYDPVTDSWTTKASIPFEVWGKAVVVDNEIYVIGSSRLQIYNPETDGWSQGAPPLVGGGYGAGVTSGVLAPKRIYVIPNAVYNPETERWMATADFYARRYNFDVAVVNDVFYAIGGHIYNYPGSFVAVDVNEQYTPFGYGTIPPEIAVVSPKNKNYTSSNISLTFTVNRPVVWTGFSLDEQDNVTIAGNTTLIGLSTGEHNVKVYARDAFENTGKATINFTIAKEPEPFPTTLVIASTVSVAVVGIGLLVYFKKRKH